MNKTKVFYAGKQPDRVYSNDDVHQIAEYYSEANYSAPWVCGHQTNSGDPAMGWVRGLEYVEEDGIGTLYAVSDFNEAGQKLIDTGLYENKSVSFYTPNSPFNPQPGVWSLRHIAMLGAEPPVLKDLGPIAVIEYSEEDTDFVSYSCACQASQKSDLAPSETVEETIETLEQSLEYMNELEKLKAELDNVKAVAEQYKAELMASKEANTALSVSAAICPYYSEGILTEDILPEATLTNVVTKLTLGATNYAEEETPLIVIETLLQALIGNRPAEPEYSENTTAVDIPSGTVNYSDGDELHALATTTAKSYGLSYGQALSAVVQAQETRGKVNFSEALAEAVKTYKV
jgi:hypothetical protein